MEIIIHVIKRNKFHILLFDQCRGRPRILKKVETNLNDALWERELLLAEMGLIKYHPVRLNIVGKEPDLWKWFFWKLLPFRGIVVGKEDKFGGESIIESENE